MRVRLAFLLILLVVLGCSRQNKKSAESSDQGAGAWILQLPKDVRPNYVDTVYNFEAWFADTPEVIVDTVTSNGISVSYTTYLNQRGDTFYIITVVDYPDSLMIGKKATDVLLDAHHVAVYRQAMRSDFELLDTTTSPYPKLYYKVTNGRMFYQGMNVIHKNIMYQIFVLNPGSYPDQQLVNKFLAGFRLKK